MATRVLVGELVGLNYANICPNKSSALLNTPPKQNRDPLRRFSGILSWLNANINEL